MPPYDPPPANPPRHGGWNRLTQFIYIVKLCFMFVGCIAYLYNYYFIFVNFIYLFLFFCFSLVFSVFHCILCIVLYLHCIVLYSLYCTVFTKKKLKKYKKINK